MNFWEYNNNMYLNYNWMVAVDGDGVLFYPMRYDCVYALRGE